MTPSLTIDFARPWRTHPRETVGLGLLGLVAAIAAAGAAGSAYGVPEAAAAQAQLPALPDVTQVRPVAPETALQINAQIPVATGPNPPARPFSMAGASAETRARALECLTSAIYYEAGQESMAGQQAVAQVVLNRVRHPAFPASVCGVVYQGSTRTTGCQFTFTCDGSLARAPEPSAWNRARKVAEAALSGHVQASVGNATHYHANYVVPYWASTLNKTDVIGAHIFYRWQGGWGRPAAFSQGYARSEASPSALRLAALSVPHKAIVPATAAAAALDEVKGVDVSQEGKRVRVLFSPKAREAVEAVKHVDYVERVAASDNLRWTLGAGAPASDEKPLGKAQAAPAAGGSSGAISSPQ